jgi:hypothetical protein
MFGKKKKALEGQVHVDIVFEKKISRLFIFRCLWMPVVIIPFAIAGIWFSLLSFIHFWYMLILGNRSQDIWAHQIHAIRYFAGWQGYLRYFTNSHPRIWPWSE